MSSVGDTHASHLAQQASDKEKEMQGIYGPGSNVVECAADMLRLLGHNMPPVGSQLEAAERSQHCS